MNKCNVQFVCHGINCEFYSRGQIDRGYVGCFWFKEGYCTNKQAQIKALIDEGFEIKEVSE